MKRIQLDSIRLNLFLVVLLGALPILAAILLSGGELREQEVRAAKTDALRLTQSFADQQESITLGVKQLLSTLAEVSDVQRLKAGACTALFTALVKQNPHHANITLLFPNGEVIASALPFSQANFSAQKHVAQALATRRFAAGEYLVGRLSAEPIIAFAQPVLDQHGELAGILTTSLKLDHFVDLFDAARLPKGSSLGLADGKGVRLMFYPHKPETNPVGGVISPLAATVFLGPAEEGVELMTNLDGVRRYLAFKQLRLEPSDPPYLVIAIGIAEGAILGKADQLTRSYLLWFAIAFGLSLATALLMGKYGIINRLRRFADLAKRVGDGDLDAVSGMAGMSGTLGIVAHAFDGMTRALKTRDAERRLAEDALRESGERFRQVVEGTDNLITQVDATGRFLYVNPVAGTILGLEPEDCVGRMAFDVVHPEDREATRRAFQGWITDKLPHVTFENRLVSLSGEVRRMLWTIDLHYDAEGDVAVIDSIAQDVTSIKHAEEAMAASLQEKEILLREIHHRVKNNLQVIASLLSLQEQSVDNPEALRIIADSRGRVMSMALVHEQLYGSQDFAGIDAQGYLRTLLARLLSGLKGNREIHLQLDVPTLSLSIEQAIPFGLIINELVTNAFKHGFRGRDRGTLRVAASTEEGVATITVDDDGQGLPMDFNLDQVTSLGLQIVRLLSQQLHGTIAFESHQGTRVRLRFPLGH